MDITTIGVVCTIVGAAVSYLGYRLNYNNDLKKDSASDAANQSIIAIKLDYISKGVDDIRLEIKAQDKRINALSLKISKIEESIKSAHKRINELGGSKKA